MIRRHQAGMTLIEVLTAVAGMAVLFGVTYVTIFQSMKLHARLHRDVQVVEDRCLVAERLTSDLAGLDKITGIAPAAFSLALRDHTTVEYQITTDQVTRVTSPAGQRQSRRYRVGKVALAFWNEHTQTWDAELPAARPALLRLQFPDSELILSEGL